MPSNADAVHRTDLPGLTRRGKVRDNYDLGDRLMIVATDRISAFDVVMDQPVPEKGVVLTRMSKYWLDTLAACRPHHLDYVVDEGRFPEGYGADVETLRGRTMICKKSAVLPIECVVRGYIVGGGWKEYQASGRVSGIELPAGLKLAQQFPEPLFTPSTKAEIGHDEPVSCDQAREILERFAENNGRPASAGRAWLEEVRRRSLDIYSEAAGHARRRGIILADTKFEFGLYEGQLLLIDEVLTPDSSRFWPASEWSPGANPPSFDKQYLRDYLNSLDWDKTPPPPALPPEIIRQTRARYLEAWRLLAGD